jgi:protocatechuate 4,5-dioxygenase alpha chain
MTGDRSRASLLAPESIGEVMSWKEHDYENIPGTYVFDGKTSHASYNLNKMLYSFNEEENREEFAKDEAAYADRYGLSESQKEALLAGDFLELLRQGANVYFLAKLAIPRGVSVQDAGAQFQGITTEEFKEKLLKRAEGFQDKLEEEGGFWNG